MTSHILSSFETAMEDIFREHNISVHEIKSTGDIDEQLQVVSAMGLSGDLRGNIIFGCSMPSAQSIVNSLFASSNIQPQEKGFGDLQKATIGEFSNQITGRALMHLSQNAIDCNMTPPTVITGDRVEPDLCTAHEKYLSCIKGSFGRLFLQVGLKAAKKE